MAEIREVVGPFGSRKFAEERSKLDAQISNENMRAAAQAAILINGGAATAVLAFLAKEKISDYLMMWVPLVLPGYAFGVAFAAFVVVFSGLALEGYAKSWRDYAVH